MDSDNFESLGLIGGILEALRDEGYEKPTPIQARSIPSLLAGRDLLGCAQTGTGKTAAFALPIIQRIALEPRRMGPRSVRTLVVAPTRELAAQIDASFSAYSRQVPLAKACVFGGVSKRPQERSLARGVDVLVATPGRLLDLHGGGSLRLDQVEVLVLDEADRMLDMGFIHDVKRIIALLPGKRQNLLFSATMPSDIAGLADSILRDPIRVSVSPRKPAVELIDQRLMFVSKVDKKELLVSILNKEEVGRALVFTRTKHGANRLAKQLVSEGLETEPIHANKSQNARTRTLDSFRRGNLRVLVATDLAARGIDVDGITHVFNYDLPEEPETYVHRIGRTARAGASGIAIAFCEADDRQYLKRIEKLLGSGIPVDSEHPFARAASLETPSPASDRRGAGRRVDPRSDGGARGGHGLSRRSLAGRGPSSRDSREIRQERPYAGRSELSRSGGEKRPRARRLSPGSGQANRKSA
jgi:ATP-dependent RNA helicase RhlE